MGWSEWHRQCAWELPGHSQGGTLALPPTVNERAEPVHPHPRQHLMLSVSLVFASVPAAKGHLALICI